MDMNDVELKLLAGMPIEIDGGRLRSPKIKDVIRIGEQKYNLYMSYLLIDKSNFGDELKDDITNFDIAFLKCYHDEDFKNVFFSALKFIFNETPTLQGNDEELFFYFGDELNHWKITRNNFSKIQELVRVSNNIQIQKDDYNPGNEKAAKFIERLKQIKASRPKPKEKMNLFSIIRGLAWRENGVNIFNVPEMTVFQLYQAFFATEKIDNYRSIVQGIYSGSVDDKKIRFADIHWANVDKN